MEIPSEGLFDHPPARRTARILIECPDADPVSVTLDGSEIDLGRSPECSIQIDFTNVSRRHACVHAEEEDFVIEDLGSTNGTHVNGVRISRCILRSNDVVGIGSCRILFVYERKREDP